MRPAAFPTLTVAFALATMQSGAAQTPSEPRFLLACVPCHGFDGSGHDRNIPNLAGQGSEYLYNQLMAFRAGQRKHPVMSFFSVQMTPEELRQTVDYYSALPKR
jgi:cytochrome c553